MARMEYSLYDGRGRRKYLVASERNAFLQAAIRAGGEMATFCAVLTFSGARISEALALTPERIDEGNGTIIFETLKRRKKGLYRAIPVPRNLLRRLDRVHQYREARHDPVKAGARLWTWCRSTGWRHVKLLMKSVGIPDYLATPKSLRHSFGTEGVGKLVPLTLVKELLGHADIRSTEIYTMVVGREKRVLTQRTWPKNAEQMLRISG